MIERRRQAEEREDLEGVLKGLDSNALTTQEQSYYSMIFTIYDGIKSKIQERHDRDRLLRPDPRDGELSPRHSGHIPEGRKAETRPVLPGALDPGKTGQHLENRPDSGAIMKSRSRFCWLVVAALLIQAFALAGMPPS